MGLSSKIVLAAANSYTDETVIGGGAIKGKNCTISSIADINGGHRVNFAWTLDDGTEKTGTMDVMNGSPIVRYNTMPSTEDLFAMDNNTVFETNGFWAEGDGFGGKYLISTSSKRGGLILSDGTNTRYLLSLDDYGNDDKQINICKYGIREYTGNLVTDAITKDSTFATQNTYIITHIQLVRRDCTFKFPVGKFVFADPIDLRDRDVNFEGACPPTNMSSDAMGNSSDTYAGTLLCFPFLTNGQTAITARYNLTNLIIYGNYNTYNITFDRTKTTSAAGEVVTETVAESSGTPIKCTGLNIVSSSVMQNVTVTGFYIGIDRSVAANGYFYNLFFNRCHYGLKMLNDNKCVGVYGWNVHTLVWNRGSLTSIDQARVDNCVHMFEFTNGNAVTLHDIDADYCTDSLIYINGDVSGLVATAVHGRCNTLKSYDGSSSDPIDVRDLDNTEGYGIIRLGNSRNLTNSFISFNRTGGQNPFDSSSNYKTPETVITMANWAKYENCTFELPIESDNDDILSLFQTRSTCKARVDTSSGTFFIKGESANDLKSIAAASSDFADFQTKIAAL